MDVDRLVDRIARRRFQCVLNLSLRIDVIAGGSGIEDDPALVIGHALRQASDWQHTCAKQNLEERATMVEAKVHLTCW